MMIFDDAGGNAEPKACAFADLFCGEKRLHYLLSDFWTDAAPTVGDRETKLLARDFLAVNFDPFFRQFLHGFKGIVDQIDEHLANLCRPTLEFQVLIAS